MYTSIIIVNLVINLIPVWDIVEVFKRNLKSKNQYRGIKTFLLEYRAVYRAVIMSVIMFIAVKVPNFELVMLIFGALFTNFI